MLGVSIYPLRRNRVSVMIKVRFIDLWVRVKVRISVRVRVMLGLGLDAVSPFLTHGPFITLCG